MGYLKHQWFRSEARALANQRCRLRSSAISATLTRRSGRALVEPSFTVRHANAYAIAAWPI